MRWWVMGWQRVGYDRQVCLMDGCDDLQQAQILASTIPGAWVDGPHVLPPVSESSGA